MRHHSPLIRPLLYDISPWYKMAVNWTGSGSFLLSRHRRRQQAPRTQYRHTVHDYVDDVQDDEWLRNNQRDYHVPSECALSPPPPVRICVEHHRDEAQSLHRSPSRHRARRPQPGWKELSRSAKGQHRSFEELRHWLLSKPNWVGAAPSSLAAARSAKKAKRLGYARVQTRPAPMLDSSNHSK